VLVGLVVAGFGIVTALAPPRLPNFDAWRAMGLALSGMAGIYGASVLLSFRLGCPEASLGPYLALGILAGLIGPYLLVTYADAVGFRYMFKWPNPNRNEPGPQHLGNDRKPAPA